MARFREIVRNRNFSLLWVGQIISQFGDRLDQMALLALIYQLTPGSTTQIAKLMAFTIIPVFLVGPIAGVYVDRWDHRRTMVVCDILRGFLILLIPFYLIRLHSLLPIYGVVFLAFCISRFYVPAKMSIIPELVPKDGLLLANSLVNTTGMVAAMLGLGLGGILVGIVGAAGGFLIDGVSFLISGLMIFFLSTKSMRLLKRERLVDVGKGIVDVVRKSAFSEMRDAVVFLKNQQQLKSCFGILFFLWAALGAIYVVSIVFIQNVFGSATREVGLLVVALGLGLFMGSIVYGRFGHKLAPLESSSPAEFTGFRVIFACLFSGGVVLLAFVFFALKASNLWLAMGLAFLLGSVVAPIMVISQTLVQQLTDSSMRGKLFSSLEIVVHLAFLLSMMLCAPLADALGPVKILYAVGFILAGTGFFGFLRKYDPARRA